MITHPDAWTGSPEENVALREKLNAYAFFALDEGLTTAYPQYAGHPLAIEVHCLDDPPPAVEDLLERVRRNLVPYGVRLTVHTVPGYR